MVRVAKRLVKGNTYYYLEHTIRSRGKRTTKSKYLGSRLPKNVDTLTREFLSELDKAKWFDDFERIRRNYDAELRSMPESAREKAASQFSVRFTYNTQRIEGSTLTLRETAELLEHQTSPSGKPMEDAKEAEAHSRLLREILEFKKELSQVVVQEWNWKLLRETKPDVAGIIRRHGVEISGSSFVPPPPVELQPQLDDFFRWYRRTRSRTNPVELAGLVHLKFVTIHPFADGNGRISRLMMNFVLHRHGFPLTDIEYRRRAAYCRSLERSQLTGDGRPFMNWFYRRYRHENSRFLEADAKG